MKATSYNFTVFKNIWLNKPEGWVALTALGVRFWFLWVFQKSPFFEPIVNGNDRALYDQLAQKISQGHVFPAGVFEYMPLYPWLLGLVYFVVGSNLYFAGLLGILIDTLTTFLIVKLAIKLGASKWGSSLMGLLYAFYPIAIIYSVWCSI